MRHKDEDKELKQLYTSCSMNTKWNLTCLVSGIKHFIANPCPILQAAADTLVVLAAVFTVSCGAAVLLFTAPSYRLDSGWSDFLESLLYQSEALVYCRVRDIHIVLQGRKRGSCQQFDTSLLECCSMGKLIFVSNNVSDHWNKLEPRLTDAVYRSKQCIHEFHLVVEVNC